MVSSVLSTALLVASALSSVSAAVIPVNFEKRGFWEDIITKYNITLPPGVTVPVDPTTSNTTTTIPTPISSTVPTTVPSSTPIGAPGNTTTVPSTGSSGPQTVAYFGQSKVSDDDSLEKFCADDSIDIIVLSFLTSLESDGGLPATNFAGYCNDLIPGTQLNSCPQWESTIQTCQTNGKKVILSIGGATGDNHLTDDSAVTAADNLWKLFGEGTGMEDKRPFGKANVDGFDLDIENKDPNGWPKLVSELRAKWEGASKSYYMTAAPQCPKPDESLQGAVYLVDYLFIQFYNNPGCQLDGLVASFNDWSSDVASQTTVDTKLFIGLPGSTAGAGSGYATPDQMTDYVSQVKSLPNFGGVMTWDAPNAASNTNNGQTFLQSMRASIS